MTCRTILSGPKPLYWILLLAVVVRGIAIIFVPEQPLPDVQSYRTAAAEFASLQPMTDNNIMPLYSLLIAVVGQGWGQKIADLVLSVASVGLMYILAIRIFGRQSDAMLAALFASLWPHFLFFTAIGLTETLFIMLMLAAFVALYYERYLLGSVVLVLAILTRPAVELLAPILVFGFAALVHSRDLSFAAKKLLAYAIVYIVLMTPWWLHNYAKYGQFVRLHTAGGMVLYTGNNPLNRSGGGVGAVDVDFSPFLGIADPVERDRAMSKAALDYIWNNPAHFVSMAVVKLGRLWRPWPHASEYTNWVIIVVSAATFIPAIGLAGWGVVLAFRNSFVTALPIFTYLGFLTAVHAITFGSIRYRIPLEPFVLIFSAAGAVDLINRFDRGRELLTWIPNSNTAKNPADSR